MSSPPVEGSPSPAWSSNHDGTPGPDGGRHAGALIHTDGGKVNDENITAGAVAERSIEPAMAPAEGTPAADTETSKVPMRPLETLSNVELAVTVELGRTRLLMKDLLSLRPGSVVELDRHVGSPVDVFVNSTLLAHGEVVVVDDELGVRITAIDTGADESGGV